VHRLDSVPLPAISATGVNLLPWDVLDDTVLPSGKFQPMFPRYLQDLAGKEVTLIGFMQPLGDGAEVASFLLVEHPIGCWYCEMPDATGIIHVELPAGNDGRAAAWPDARHGPIRDQRYRSGRFSVRYPRGSRRRH